MHQGFSLLCLQVYVRREGSVEGPLSPIKIKELVLQNIKEVSYLLHKILRTLSMDENGWMEMHGWMDGQVDGGLMDVIYLKITGIIFLTLY